MGLAEGDIGGGFSFLLHSVLVHANVQVLGCCSTKTVVGTRVLAFFHHGGHVFAILHSVVGEHRHHHGAVSEGSSLVCHSHRRKVGGGDNSRGSSNGARFLSHYDSVVGLPEVNLVFGRCVLNCRCSFL